MAEPTVNNIYTNLHIAYRNDLKEFKKGVKNLDQKNRAALKTVLKIISQETAETLTPAALFSLSNKLSKMQYDVHPRPRGIKKVVRAIKNFFKGLTPRDLADSYERATLMRDKKWEEAAKKGIARAYYHLAEKNKNGPEYMEYLRKGARKGDSMCQDALNKELQGNG